MEVSQEIKDKIKTCKMKLLFTQTRELYEEFQKEDLFRNHNLYYIVDKRWLDDYKKKNGYDKIVTELKDNQEYKDYRAVKENLLKELNIDEKVFTTIGQENLKNSFSIEKQNLEDYQLKVPKNIELVSYSFIKDDYLGDSPEKSSELQYLNFYGGYLGDKTIIIYGTEGNIYFAYCCSLLPNKENEYNFSIKVDYILIFNDPNAREDQLERISILRGLKNYLYKLKIDINKEDEQIIRDEYGYMKGIFLKFKEENNNDGFKKEKSVIKNNPNKRKKLLISYIMEDNQEIKNIIKTCKMKLLFTQTRRLNKAYNNNIIIEYPNQFYFVDKKWLDDYKKKNNYDEIVKKLINNQGNYYYSVVKDKLLEELALDKNDLLTTIEEENLTDSFSIKKQNLEKYKLKVPKNVEIVCSDFVHDCFGFSFKENLKEMTVCLGAQTILIKEDNNNSLYCCSLISNKEDDFLVKVDYILIFKDYKIYDDQTEVITKSGGIKNYLKEKNIDINKEEEQDIRDKNGQTIGTFIKFQEENNNDRFKKKKRDINNKNNMNFNNRNNNNNNNDLNPNEEWIQVDTFSKIFSSENAVKKFGKQKNENNQNQNQINNQNQNNDININKINLNQNNLRNNNLNNINNNSNQNNQINQGNNIQQNINNMDYNNVNFKNPMNNDNNIDNKNFNNNESNNDTNIIYNNINNISNNNNKINQMNNFQNNINK